MVDPIFACINRAYGFQQQGSGIVLAHYSARAPKQGLYDFTIGDPINQKNGPRCGLGGDLARLRDPGGGATPYSSVEYRLKSATSRGQSRPSSVSPTTANSGSNSSRRRSTSRNIFWRSAIRIRMDIERLLNNKLSEIATAHRVTGRSLQPVLVRMALQSLSQNWRRGFWNSRFETGSGGPSINLTLTYADKR